MLCQVSSSCPLTPIKVSQGPNEILPKLQPLEENFRKDKKEITEALNQNVVLNAVLNQNSVSIP